MCVTRQAPLPPMCLHYIIIYFCYIRSAEMFANEYFIDEKNAETQIQNEEKKCSKQQNIK